MPPKPQFFPLAENPGVDRREVALIAACSAVLFVNLLFLVYTFFKRKYLPLKSKNLPLMYWTYFSTVMWFIGNIYSSLRIAPKTNWFTCVVTYTWLRMSLGGYLWMSLFQYRVYQYIVIFTWKRRITGRCLWLPLSYIVSIPLIYAVVAAALPQDIGFTFIAPLQMCTSSNWFFYLSISFVFFQLLVFAFIIYMARTIHTCFNEYREIVICFIVATLALIAGIATFWIPLTPSRVFLFGVLNTVLPLLIAQVYFIVLLARPIYHSIVDSEEYLKFFLNRMKESRLIREYQMANNDPTTGGGRDASSEQSRSQQRVSEHEYYRPEVMNRVFNQRNRAQSMLSTADTL
ncbi:hypothetical protein GQ54DRAFT_297581 [Martensiomyces pterosporus]|nr:hypothetical protein GQ54DRAFT_297581 [Martensiomyces pterosporus]